MKFSLFVHLERTSSGRSQQQLYKEFVELSLIAEKGGMSAIWTGEHHAMNFTIAPNPFLLLVDLAHRTKHVRLGTGTVVAPFWHPIKLAEEIAMTDIITEGRLDVGIARGAYSFEYERLGKNLDAATASEMLRETIPAIKHLWQGDYEHNGKYWKFPKTTSSPKPIQAVHPPLWIAARNRKSHEFAVSNGCNVQVTPLWQGDGEVENLMKHFDCACDIYKPKKRPKIMLLRHTYIGEGEADITQASEEINLFYNYFGAWFKNERPISQGLMKELSADEVANHPFYNAKDIRRDNAIGNVDTVIERLKFYETLGYDEYSFWIDSGMSFERKKASLERFIKYVMPAFQ